MKAASATATPSAPASTPAQTVEKLVPYVMKKWGKKVYIVAADYNYGQITCKWVKKYVAGKRRRGASIDFFPLDVTNFGPTIKKIQAAKPDMVFSALVGGAHISFYRQWAAAGMKQEIPMASTTFGVGNEHIVLSPEEADGIAGLATTTSRTCRTPVNEKFVAALPASASATTIRTSPNSRWGPTRVSSCGRRP